MCTKLTIEKSKCIKNKLLQELDRYSISKNGYWFPLCEIPKNIKSVSFLREDLNNENWGNIYYILKSENIKNIFEMQELSDYIKICDLEHYFFERDEDGYDMLFIDQKSVV